MKKNITSFIIIFFLLAAVLNNSCFAQTTETYHDNKVNHQPSQLHYPDERVRKYVNFPFITYMLGLPTAITNANRNWGGVPTQLQICYPYSLFRKKFPIAIGFNFGVSRIGFKDAQLVFGNKQLLNIAPDATMKKAVQRNWYAGISVLKTIKLSQPLRLLAGPSFLLNYSGRLKQETKAGVTMAKVNTSQFIRRISVPLQIQANYSTRQFAGIGVWARIPTTPVFRGSAYNDLRVFQVGILLAVIF